MKTSLLFLSFLFLTATAFAQNTLIVDNTGSAPTGDHIYTDLQEAIDAAQEGDIIQVMPSPNSYGSIIFETDITGITIFGSGYLPNNIGVSQLGTVIVKGDEIRISGFEISSLDIDSESATDKASNIFIENSELNRLQVFNAASIVFNSCFINPALTSAVYPDFHRSSSGIVISNSVILARFDNFNNTEAINSIFASSNGIANDISGNTFKDNIILTSIQSSSDNQFINNFSIVQLSIGIDGNTGSDNIIDENATVENVFETDGTNWLNEFNPNLPEGSSLIGAASDGSDLGVFGGSSPYSQTGIPLPYIQELIAPLTIKKGSDTEVTIKAKGN